MTIRWGLSMRDWRSHAIDDQAEHPDGALAAQCGRHLLPTVLRDELHGVPCPDCLALQLATTRAMRLAATVQQLQQVRGLLGDLTALAGSRLPAAQLRPRLRALAQCVDEAAELLAQQLSHLADACAVEHHQLLRAGPGAAGSGGTSEGYGTSSLSVQPPSEGCWSG